MNWIEAKYVSQLNSKVRNFKRKSANLWNFSCPLCNDSEKNSKKARGYVYESKGKLRYHCHNCSIDKSFDSFLKEVDSALHAEMKLEQLEEYKKTNKPDVVIFAEKMKKPAFIKNTGLSELQKVSQLSPSHFCKKYIDSRHIPTVKHAELFFAPKFMEWTNTMIQNKFTNLSYDEPRLVIPFLDSQNNLIGYQGRSFKSNNSVRYITIMLDEDKPRIYGLNRIDFNKRYYVTEGPIDSMFLTNAISTAGADIVSELEKMKCNKQNAVIIYDNEPRNKDTVKKIQKAIKKGWKVVIWPTSALEKEDINDLYIMGLPLMEIINMNIYSGLTATAKLTEWKRSC